MYNHIFILLIKGYKLLINQMCDATKHRLYVSGLTAVNEVRKHIFYILGDIIIFLHQWLCGIMWLFSLS